MNNNVGQTLHNTGSKNGLGMVAFVSYILVTLVYLVLYFIGQWVYPCIIPGATLDNQFTRCNNEPGWLFSVSFFFCFLGYALLALPTVFIMSIIGLSKNSGFKWSQITLIGVGLMTVIIMISLMF